MSLFQLPADYVARSASYYFDDSPFFDGTIVHQPEIYEAADYFLQAGGRTRILDIGCGNGRKLRQVRAREHIGVDFGPNIDACRQRFGAWGTWLDADLCQRSCASVAAYADASTVVVCADVVEHLLDPTPLLNLLAQCYRRGAIVITSTPDRVKVRGADDKGPPANPAHVREWALDEYIAFLEACGLPATHAGHTINNNIARALRTIVTVHDITVDRARAALATQPQQRPLAILAAYNEADVIAEVVEDLIEQGCDVAAIDNWSTDETWPLLRMLAARHPHHVRIERFPQDGPAKHYEWRRILQRKAQIAHGFAGRWILHTDADELRRSPFPGLDLATALHVAAQAGANRVASNLIHFRPIDARPFRPGTLKSAFSHFEFGTRPGHFKQVKAWLQGPELVDLASSGGHVASFPGAVDFPYRFLLRHYPIRSAAHGRRKILAERRTRWSPEERALGWHVQYDDFSETAPGFWHAADLVKFDGDFWRDHGLPLITDIAERRWAESPVSTGQARRRA
ncbi:methyltransferase domain-containing protein [Roseixanthobacter glucoisosaccharinicivorans]|uniref:methyltransferase domain-containing protein n=1 Tax=Roseixanthobacter glucoisosaccharinicivorans TaxID=3119923 RepID=UPI003729259B